MNSKDLNDLNERIWDLKDKEYFNEEDTIKAMYSLISDLFLLQAGGQEETKKIAQSVAMVSTVIGILTEKVAALEKKINEQ
tara:strand:+ start:271 stop:513 length:243 start_codon:yes stop_codon:yes gene_type:complete